MLCMLRAAFNSNLTDWLRAVLKLMTLGHVNYFTHDVLTGIKTCTSETPRNLQKRSEQDILSRGPRLEHSLPFISQRLRFNLPTLLLPFLYLCRHMLHTKYKRVVAFGFEPGASLETIK